MKRVLLASLVVLTLFSATPAKKRRTVAYDPNLPALGTRLRSLPAGAGKTTAEGACLPCHSSDILLQQRLTEKQWTATVEKMIRWGAAVPDDQKAPLIAYLSKHFGPENKFEQVKVRPVGY